MTKEKASPQYSVTQAEKALILCDAAAAAIGELKLERRAGMVIYILEALDSGGYDETPEQVSSNARVLRTPAAARHRIHCRKRQERLLEVIRDSIAVRLAEGRW